MGDPNRFRAFADLIVSTYPDRSLRIADVASGKGLLRAELFQRGYRRVESWDVRKRNATGRPGYVYGLFDYRTAPAYDLVLGMHPDGGTDQVVKYGCTRRVPFAVCPCCVIPTATEFAGDYDGWMGHLAKTATEGGLRVSGTDLGIQGRSRVLVGEVPK